MHEVTDRVWGYSYDRCVHVRSIGRFLTSSLSQPGSIFPVTYLILSFTNNIVFHDVQTNLRGEIHQRAFHARPPCCLGVRESYRVKAFDGWVVVSVGSHWRR